MTPRLGGRQRIRAEWLLITLCLSGLAVAATLFGWFRGLDNAIHDTALALERPSLREDTVIVAIDDASLRSVGQWPWRRTEHARLLDRLGRAGARVIVLDVLLAEASDPADDRALAEALRRNGNVVLAAVPGEASGHGWDARPLPMFAAAAAATGHVLASVDDDGVLRGFVPEVVSAGERYRHLALAALARQAWLPPLPAATGLRFPLARSDPARHRVSAADVLAGRVAPERFAGATVFIGVTASGVGDYHAVPAWGSSLLPGVEVHAAIFEAARGNALIVPLPMAWAALVATVLVVAMMSLLSRLGAGSGGVFVLGGAFIVVLLAAVLLNAGIWWPPAGTLAALCLCYPLWSWRRLEAAERFFDEQMARLTSGWPAPERASAFDRLSSRIDRVRALQAQLESEHQRREQTLQFISHDIRAPLTAIISLLDLVEHDPERMRDEDWFNTLNGAARRSLCMADDFLRLARAEAIDAAAFEPVDLVAVLEEAVDDVWPQARAKGGAIERRLSHEEAYVRGDPGLLQRVFANLLTNAVAHGDASAPIAVGLTALPGEWAVSVSNAPLPGDRRSAGHGLGLRIVETIVAGHGGRIDAAVAGVGVHAVRVYLPAAG